MEKRSFRMERDPERDEEEDWPYPEERPFVWDQLARNEIDVPVPEPRGVEASSLWIKEPEDGTKTLASSEQQDKFQPRWANFECPNGCNVLVTQDQAEDHLLRCTADSGIKEQVAESFVPTDQLLECPNGCGMLLSPVDAEQHVLVCTSARIGKTCIACHEFIPQDLIEQHEAKLCPKLKLLRRLKDYRSLFDTLENRGAVVAEAIVQDQFDKAHAEKAVIAAEAKSDWNGRLDEMRKEGKKIAPVRDHPDEDLRIFLDETNEEEVEIYEARFGPRWDLLRAQLRQRANARL